MNCQHFEAIITDLARQQMLDADEREKALTHAGDCERCTARLADERALTAGLRALASLDSNEAAPGRVEASLLVALRRRETATGEPAASAAGGLGRPRRSRRWLAAAAAVIALALLAAGVLRSGRGSRNEPPHQAVAPETPQLDAPAPPRHPESQAPAPDKSEDSVIPAPRREQRINKKLESRLANAAKGTGKTQPQEEIFTDFIPLVHASAFDATGSGQVMRVELPRSALTSFGLPMNVERASQRIKADLVVGDDGVARAIRFVR